MIETIVGQSVTFTDDMVFEDYATAYIKQNNAMTDGEVTALKTAICKA